MINYKWSLGIVALSLGLSACNMDMHRSEQMNPQYQESMQHQKQAAAATKHKAVQKTYASKDPTQQATPGPVRKAAPQLPVIQ